MFSKKLAKDYISDLESHRLYKHDETAIPGMPYTYSAKEVIEVKLNDRHLLLPFDLLWYVVDENEVLVNEIDGVYQKYPKNLKVKDKGDVYTNVSVITKKLRKRDLVRVKTSFGEDLIVTDNHPMIVNLDDINDTIPAIDILNKEQYKLNNKLVFDGQLEIDTISCPDTYEYTEKYNQDVNNNVTNRFVKLDEEFGYFVGILS